MHLQFHAMLDIHCVYFYCMYCDFTLHGIILHCFDHIKFVGTVLGVHWWGTGSTCMGVQRSAWRMTQPCITRRCTCSTVSELCVYVCCSAERAQCHKVMYTRVCVCTHVGYMQYNILPFFRQLMIKGAILIYLLFGYMDLLYTVLSSLIPRPFHVFNIAHKKLGSNIEKHWMAWVRG